MERRKPESKKSSPLPKDFLKMVNEVFSANFGDGLKAMKKLTHDDAYFDSNGHVYPTEVVLAVTLIQGKNLSATTVYASSDYDPKASAPTIQDVLSLCVDAIGSVYQPLLDANNKSQLENLASATLSALEEVPFEWTPIVVEKQKLFVKVDKANPKLDQLADEWLEKHDKTRKQREAEEEEETKRLFVTGPSSGKKPDSIH